MHDVATKMAIVCVGVVLAFFISASTAATKYEAKQKVRYFQQVESIRRFCLLDVAFRRMIW